MQVEMQTQETPERVVAFAEECLMRGALPDDSSVARPGGSPNIVQATAFTQKSGFPTTVLGWVFNLTMTAVTFGVWLLPWIIYVTMTVGDIRTHQQVVVTAYPDEGDGRITNVTMTSTDESWGAAINAPLTRRYGAQRAA